MCAYFVDYENMNGKNLATLEPAKKGDCVVVFYGRGQKKPCCDKVLNTFLGGVSGHVSYVPTLVCEKNALDFQLVSELGLYAETNPFEAIHIVSNDRGFDAAAAFMCKKGFSIDRLGTDSPQSAYDLSKILSKADMPAEVSKILEAHGRPTAVSSALNSLYRDSKHAGEVYRKIKPFIGKKKEVQSVTRTVWDAKRMAVEDLPTLGDVLRAADAELLAKEVVRIVDPKAKGKERAKARRRVIETIEEMHAIEPVASDPADEWVLIPLLNCDYLGGRSGGKLELRMSAELISVNELWMAGAELCGLASEKGDGSLACLTGYGYEWTPWKEMLGCRVWMGGFAAADKGAGVARLGGDGADAPGEKALLPRLARASQRQVMSRRDRYQFLADIACDMTFCGWTQKRQEHRAEKFVAKIQKSCEACLDECCTGEVFFSQMGWLDAANVGLEASTDDYKDEHERVAEARSDLLGEWLRLDFLRRANELHNLLKRGYSKDEGSDE